MLFFLCAFAFLHSFSLRSNFFTLVFLRVITFCALFSSRFCFFALLLFSSCFCFFCALFYSSYHFFIRSFAFLHSFLFFHYVALVLFFFALLLFELFFLCASLFWALFSLRFRFVLRFLHSFFFLAFFALFFLCAFMLIFASHSRAQTATKAPSAHLWLLLSLIATESVQESTEKLPPHVVMTSLAYIQDQVPRERYFLQGPCFYGQRRICLALCILFSLYVYSTPVLLGLPVNKI